MGFALTVNNSNVDYTDWTSASLTRSIEQPAASFSFSAPHPQKNIQIKVQDEIEISIDDKTQTKGKIFKIKSKSNANDATRSYSGRSSIADVIDSSIPVSFGLKQKVSAKNIINELLKPYPIVAEFIIEPKGIVELKPNPGDTAWQAIDKLLQKENLLAFELKPGILTIDRAPDNNAFASLQFGTQDILGLEGYSLDISNRFENYTVIGEGILGSAASATGKAVDKNIKGRSLIIQLSGNVDNERCQIVADYEAAVRAARSLGFSYRVPNWYTNNGDLWIPNKRVNIEDEENDINGEHLLTSVTLHETDQDEWAVLKFAPPESYTLAPPLPPASNNLFTT